MLSKKDENGISDKNSSLAMILTNVLGFCVFAVVLLLTFHDKAWMHNAFTYFSYYIVLALCAVWALSLIDLFRYKQSNGFRFLQQYWKGILISFLLASVVFVSVPKYFRVLSDETNLLSVAKSMTYSKNVQNITEGRWYYEMFWATPTTGTEKRPFLFPFFTSLVHNLLGYHVENVFILNYFALWAMLFLLFIAIQSSLGDLWAACGLILVVAQPVIDLSATSASFEIFNFLFIIASFLALRGFLNDPQHKTFIALVMTLIMLANVRYESILFLVIVLVVLGVTGRIKPKFFTQSFNYALAMFFLLPLIWQRVLLASESDSNLVGGSWVKAFSFENAQHNILLFFQYILQPSGQLGYAGVVNIAGIVALVLLGLQVLFKKVTSSLSAPRNDTAQILLICSSTSLLVLFLIVIFYQGGINDHPLNGRFYIPILVAFSIAPIYFFANLFKDKQKLLAPVFIGCLVAFGFYHPVAVEDRLTNTLIIIREYKYVESFLKKNADKNTLVIWGRPGELIVSNYGAISYGTANQEVDTILGQFKNHLYSRIYAIQSIAYSNNAPLSDNVIDPRYKLDTIDQLQITGEYYFRISSVQVPG